MVPPNPSSSVLARLRLLGITAREAEVLYWMAHAKTCEEIGIILGVARHTVHTHTKSLFRKLNVTRRVAAAACAFGVLASDA